jgi:hypothetical protein
MGWLIGILREFADDPPRALLRIIAEDEFAHRPWRKNYRDCKNAILQ